MPVTIVQVINEDVKVFGGFATINKASQYINSLQSIIIKGAKKTIQGVISVDEELDMDGYYIQKTSFQDSFNIIERKTVVVPGWVTNGIAHSINKIGFIKLVDETNQNTESNDDFIVVQSTKKDSKPKLFAFSPEITKEFMKVVQKKQKDKQQKA